MSEVSEEYGVSGLCLGHTDDIRAACILGDGTIVTGGRDSCVKIWRHESGTISSPLAEIQTASWVMSLCTITEGATERYPLGGFVIGCQNGDILVVAAGDTTVGSVLSGHTAPVCSLYYDHGLLVSGSWDETATLWSIDDEVCLRTFPGHENQVCVLLLPNNDLVTGSTGIRFQDPDAPEKYGVIEHKLRVWREGVVLHTMTDHQAGIRDLALITSEPLVFASASNDGSVRLWDAAYLCIHICNLGDDMVLAICAGPECGQWTAVDMAGRAWIGDVSGQVVAKIQHPKSLWNVASSLLSGNVITVGEDRIVRSWTKNTDQILPEEEVRRAEEAALAAKQSTQTSKTGQTHMEHLIASLPSDKSQYRGEDGAIALFKDPAMRLVQACRYSNATKQWQTIGPLQEPLLLDARSDV